MHEDRLRLFFAIPCSAALAARIAAWRAEQHFVGRLVAPANLHLTLAFLGHLPASRVAQLEAIPAGLPLSEYACQLRLDRLACWRGGLLHLAPSLPPSELLALAAGLNLALAAAGLPCERRTYRPHLTLARDSRLPAAHTPADFTWPVEELVLYQSLEGRYLPLRRWPLAPQ